MVNFSVVLIGCNESKTLPRLMKSLQEFQRRAGEVILVDTGSTDGTPEVARNLGVVVYEAGEKFIFHITPHLADKINKQFVVEGEPEIVKAGDKLFDFSDARNFAARFASNDVISMCDCDEQYTNLNIDAVEERIKAGFEQFEFQFIFSHLLDGKPAVQFRQCKMYDRRKLHWRGIVHEVLEGSAKLTYFEPEILLIEHFQEPQEHRARYLAGLSLDCYLNQNNDRNSHYLGRELLYTGRAKSAIKELTRHVAMDKWPAERGQSMIFMGDAYRGMSQEKDAIAAYNKAFEIDGGRREALLRLANLYWQKNDPQRTACYCAAALEIPWTDFYANNLQQYTFEPHEMMYWALWWLGRREESKLHWQKAIGYAPFHPKFNADKQFYAPEEFEYRQPEPNIDGWMTLGELDWLHRTAKTVNSILEVGSWKGRSTHALLTGCKGKVTSVDTFQGSQDERDLTKELAKKSDIYSEFQRNVGHFENLEVLRMTSEEAASKCKAEGRKFDMIFIDAEHTYDGVKKDIDLWRGMATKVFSGHDYQSGWMGVVQAVDESVGKPEVHETIWSVKANKPDVLPDASPDGNGFKAEFKGRYPADLTEFTEKIKSGQPFTFVKCGDGELDCMGGQHYGQANCDGQSYTPELAEALRTAYQLFSERGTYLSHWDDAAFDPERDGRILLHWDENKDLLKLKAFYVAIRESKASKVLVGPSRLAKVASILRAGFVTVPQSNAYSDTFVPVHLEQLAGVPGTIFIFSAGLASKVWIASLLENHPDCTFIDAGSSFDPLFVGPTRTHQKDRKSLEALYGDWLERIPRKIFSIWLSEEPESEWPNTVKKCIESQKKMARDFGYEYHLMTLDNLPGTMLSFRKYLRDAIESKSWVKASDILRVQRLYESGGIYCDADVEILPGRNFNDLLKYEVFVGQEENGFLVHSVMGSVPGHGLLRDHIDEVLTRFKGDDRLNFESSVEILTQRIVSGNYSGVKVLSPDYFTPYNHQNGVINVTDNTISFHHFMKSWTLTQPDKLPSVAILIPTLDRPEGLARCLASIDRLYYPKHLIEVLVDGASLPITILTVPIKVNRLAARSRRGTECFVYAADDMEFDPWCLYEAVRCTPGLVAFNAGPVLPDEGNICEHFLIRRSLVEKFGGEIFCERFHHVGCDNLLWAKAKKLDQACRHDAAKITHRHFTKTGVMDETYQRGWSRVESDRAILKEELEKLSR